MTFWREYYVSWKFDVKKRCRRSGDWISWAKWKIKLFDACVLKVFLSPRLDKIRDGLHVSYFGIIHRIFPRELSQETCTLIHSSLSLSLGSTHFVSASHGWPLGTHCHVNPNLVVDFPDCKIGGILTNFFSHTIFI